MRSAARLAVARDVDAAGRMRTRISRLRSESPLVLRPTTAAGPTPLRCWNLSGTSVVRVALVAGAAGPVGGDQLRFDIEVGAGAALVLRSVAATLALPGPHGQPSRSEVTVRVDAHATLVWLPHPLIAARGCDHHTATRVILAPSARLLLREELILGRHGEPPGSVRQHLRIVREDRPLYDQELHVGAPGWDGPAVTGGRRAVGSLVVVDPVWADAAPGAPTVAVEVDAGRLPLDGPAVLLSALGADALSLRRRLDDGLTDLDVAAGSVWSLGR